MKNSTLQGMALDGRIKMDVIIFSDNNKIKGCFENLEKSRLYRLSYINRSEFNKTVKTFSNKLFIYYDITGYEEIEQQKIIKTLSNKNGINYGILDPKGIIKDIALQFHIGTSDYIGKELLETGITTKRFKKVLEYCSVPETTEIIEEKKDPSTKWILSGNSWENIKQGIEYTFCFMFIELDINSDWKIKSGKKHLGKVNQIFHNHITKVITPLNGKIWMWTEFGGLILFPFNGKSLDPILAGFRLILSRIIISAEEYSFNTIISYRIALHIGNTVYKDRGDTGTIISDTVNYIFHLGQQFAKPGNFYMTQEVSRHIPAKLDNFFVSAGVFKENNITRMKLPV